MNVKFQKAVLFDYLVRFLHGDKSKLFPEMQKLLGDMIQDDNINLDTFIIFVKYFLGE